MAAPKDAAKCACHSRLADEKYENEDGTRIARPRGLTFGYTWDLLGHHSSDMMHCQILVCGIQNFLLVCIQVSDESLSDMFG